MEESADKKVKIRFKFKSGEEFEAEGSPEFIEKQRADFLQIIGKESQRIGKRPPSATAHSSLSTAPYPGPTQNTVGTDNVYSTNLSAEDHFIEPIPTVPAFYRQEGGEKNSFSGHVPSPQTPLPSPGLPQNTPAPYISMGISAAETARYQVSAMPRLATAQELRLWEQLVRVEDNLVFLRRKSRQLSADSAALLLLAAAQILLKSPDGYSALSLSKSLKKSGYGGERLDRVLGGELKQGNVRSEGSKRSRLYQLSDGGFARAYVLANKLAQE